MELFFKWIKQHLRIKRFLGTSENAVKTQIWCAAPTYVLIAIGKKELQLHTSLYTLLQILSVSIFEKTQLAQLSLFREKSIDFSQCSVRKWLMQRGVVFGNAL